MTPWIVVVGIVCVLLGLLWLTRSGARDLRGGSDAEREALGREPGRRMDNGPSM